MYYFFLLLFVINCQMYGMNKARRMPGSGIMFAYNTIGDGSYGGSVTGDSGT